MERGLGGMSCVRDPSAVMEARISSSPIPILRPKTLKRTISKCGIDAAMHADRRDILAPKKIAPLHEIPSSLHHLIPQRPKSRSHVNDSPSSPIPSISTYIDHNEAILLPRVVHLVVENDQQDDSQYVKEPEFSPTLLYGDEDTISSAKDRYYESVIESCTNTFVSPSPHHVMYPYTPNGNSDTASTVSMYSSVSGYSPGTHPISSNGLIPPSNVSTINREYVSAASLHAIVLDYLQELFSYCDRARTFTFGHVGQMVQSVPFAFKYIQGIVKDRLGITWHLVGEFVENFLDFICDEDIRDATIMEFATFLCCIQEKLYENMPPGNIFGNLYDFFQRVLIQFKKYLVAHWLEIGKIMYPCEFGKKSDTLFLCMECHREHW